MVIKVPGTVTLSATIRADGTIGTIRVVRADSNNAAVRQTFTEAATNNLATWRLEAGPKAERIQVTYAYVIDVAVDPGRDRVEFNLPNRVTITANR
jgi:hypothetical protein